jgi:hypothetical protein
LDTAVYRLRKLLGNEAAVRSRGGLLSLDPALCWTDTRVFAVLCQRASALSAVPGTSLEEIARLERSLNTIFCGPLADEGDPRALRRAAERLQTQYERARATLAAARSARLLEVTQLNRPARHVVAGR